MTNHQNSVVLFPETKRENRSNGFQNTFRGLMIFLVLCTIFSAGLYSQNYMPVTKTYFFEKSSRKTNEPKNSNEAITGVPEKNIHMIEMNLSRTPHLFTQIDKKTMAFLLDHNQKEARQESQNYLYLSVQGDHNAIAAIQRGGRGNFMNLGVEGNSNVANYLQQGNDNYIYDRVVGNDKYREIKQYGYGHGIYNQGMQTIPMIIEQRGRGMKIKIK